MAVLIITLMKIIILEKSTVNKWVGTIQNVPMDQQTFTVKAA